MFSCLFFLERFLQYYSFFVLRDLLEHNRRYYFYEREIFSIILSRIINLMTDKDALQLFQSSHSFRQRGKSSECNVMYKVYKSIYIIKQ